MSKTTDIRVRVGSTDYDNTDTRAVTVVHLVDDNGKPVGRAVLETKPGLGLHYRFENTIKLMIK